MTSDPPPICVQCGQTITDLDRDLLLCPVCEEWLCRSCEGSHAAWHESQRFAKEHE